MSWKFLIIIYSHPFPSNTSSFMHESSFSSQTLCVVAMKSCKYSIQNPMPPLMHGPQSCFKPRFILHKTLQGFEVPLNRVHPLCVAWTTIIDFLPNGLVNASLYQKIKVEFFSSNKTKETTISFLRSPIAFGFIILAQNL
jgi:hypothetical protein